MTKNIESKKKLTNIRHKYGWVPDIPDQRDYTFEKLKLKYTKLPQNVDLRDWCSNIEDQDSIGSCTAQALVGNLEFLEMKNKVQKYEDLSRLFVYYNERVIENSIKYDSGAMIRDGIKTLNKQGVCSEKLWPYYIYKFKNKPTVKCYTDALNHRIVLYYRLNTLIEMKTCLANGYPFVFGFSVYESFETDEVANTGTVPMPDNNEQLLGGHAVCAIGYNDSKQRFIVRNSWGEEWGMKGYFTIPYAYLTDRNLSDDIWSLRKAKGF